MIKILKNVDDEMVENLYEIYSESMEEILHHSNYGSREKMIADYKNFLQAFIAKDNQLVIVENYKGVWVSGLRAIKTSPVHWHIEAVETRPDCRQRGYGKLLMQHTIEYLSNTGMKSMDCAIAKNNIASQKLHEKVGFVCSNKSPIYNGQIAKNIQIYLYEKRDLER